MQSRSKMNTQYNEVKPSKRKRKLRLFAAVAICFLVLGFFAGVLLSNSSLFDGGEVTYFLDSEKFSDGVVSWGYVEQNKTYTRMLCVNNYEAFPVSSHLTVDAPAGVVVSWSLDGVEVPARTWVDGYLQVTVDGEGFANLQFPLSVSA